jgi:hypothetical protein
MKTTLIGVAAWLLAVSTASADVQLTMQNGRVTLVAKDATVRQILAEWARVGHTKIVNLEAVPGGPITLELNNVTEAQALDVLLRSLSGYIAAPRAVEVANFSQLDRIIIMPTLAAARPAVSSPPAPVFQQTPQFFPAADEADDERPGPNVPAPGGPRGPVFNTFPQPQTANPQIPQPGMPSQFPAGQPGMPSQFPVGQPAPSSQPSPTPVAPYGGVAVPGMVAPPPPGQSMPPGQSPSQTGSPSQSPSQIRRPGGQ